MKHFAPRAGLFGLTMLVVLLTVAMLLIIGL